MRKLVGSAAVLVAMAGAHGARAEDSGPTFTFGASTSYVYDINDPDSGAPGLNSLTYANLEAQDEAFNIDLVQLGVTGERGAASYGATIDFGDLARAAGDSADGDVALQTAWLDYTFAETISTTAGRFGTPIGYEVLEPWGNANISRSWGWTAQPINHDGLKVGGNAGPVALMIGAVNSFTVGDPAGNDVDDDKGVIGSAGFDPMDALGLYFSAIYTKEADEIERTMLNGIVKGTFPLAAEGDSFGYVVEANWRDDDFDSGGSSDLWNLTGYLTANVSAMSFAARGDYTDDEDLLTGTDTSLWSLTLTAGYALTDGVTFRVEYRHDDADDDVFGEDDGGEDTLDTLQAQLLWTPAI